MLIKSPKSKVKPRNRLAFSCWKQFLERNGPHKGFDYIDTIYWLIYFFCLFIYLFIWLFICLLITFCILLIHLLIYLLIYYLFTLLISVLICLVIYLLIYLISYLYIYVFVVRIPTEARHFFSSPNRSVHRTSFSVGTEANFAGVKAGLI